MGTKRKQEIDEARKHPDEACKHLQAQQESREKLLSAQNQQLLKEQVQRESREKQLLEELSRLRASQQSVPHDDALLSSSLDDSYCCDRCYHAEHSQMQQSVANEI